MQFVPDFASRRELTLEELVQLDEPAVIYEHFHVDDDGVHAYVYTVGGWLNGRNVCVSDVDGSFMGGCTVGGDVIIIHAADRQAADDMAGQGLEDTIQAQRANAGRISRDVSIEAAVRSVLRQ